MQLDSEDIEIAGGDNAVFGKHLLVGRIGRLAGDVNVGVDAPVLDGQDVDEARGLHSGQM